MKWLILVLLLLSGCSSKTVSGQQWNQAMNDTLFDQSDRLEGWGVTLSEQDTVTRREACRMMREAYGDPDADCIEMGWLSSEKGKMKQEEMEQVLDRFLYSMDHPSTETSYQFEREEEMRQDGPDSQFDSLKMQTAFTVDWNQVEVEPLQPSATFLEPLALSDRRLQFQPLLSSQQFEYKGYRVRWSVSQAGIHVHASKQTPLQMRTQISLDLNRLHPVIQWEKDHRRFQLDFDMNQKIGIHKGMMNTLSSDFSHLDPHDLLQSLKNSFHNGPTPPDTVIPIARFTIPIPQIPSMDLGLVLSLHCYSGGKAELVLSQNGSIGVEVRNHTVRAIHSLNHEEEVQIQGSSSLTAALTAMVNVAGVSLMDIRAQSGIRGVLRTTGWLDEGATVQKTDLGEMPSHDLPVHPQLKFCSDINVHGILNLSCNSENSVAGRLGFDHQLNLIDERNGTLNPGGLTHIENGMFVKECTRNKKKPQGTALPTVEVAKTIRLKATQLILDPLEQSTIMVLALPETVRLSDLVYTVDDPSVATVLQNGKITAVRAGNAMVTVSDPTGRYQAFVHVYVREKK